MVFAIEPEERLPIPSADEVRAQLADWKERISRLFADIRNWAPPDLTVDSSKSVDMLEPLMERYGIAPQRMPVLEFRRGTEPLLTFVPDALWVLPTRGRVLVEGGTERVKLLDVSEDGASPRWVVMDRDWWERGDRPFDRDLLNELLARVS